MVKVIDQIKYISFANKREKFFNDAEECWVSNFVIFLIIISFQKWPKVTKIPLHNILCNCVQYRIQIVKMPQRHNNWGYYTLASLIK
jgi:hypothetical protein